MNLVTLRISVLLALSSLPFATHAAGGAFEINQDCIAVGCFAGDSAGFPLSITQPGSYVLTSDIVVPAGTNIAISINASPVDLDLNHHAIDGGGSCSGIPVSSCTAGNGTTGISSYSGGHGVAQLHIHDGTIRGFTNGAFSGAMYLSDVGDGTALERLNVVENGGSSTAAIELYTSGVGGAVQIRDSHIVRSDAYGIANNSGALASAVTVILENNDISGNGLFGVTGFSGTYTGNRFNSNGNYAINAAGLGYFALGSNSFSGNNGGGANPQYSGLVRDMGGNVCIDHTPCP